MRCNHIGLAILLTTTVIATGDDEKGLRKRLDDQHAQGVELWIYNDIAKGIEVARKQNKPLFVTFRCVPCRDCRSFDGEVAKGSETIHKLAREHFVSVRQVEMKGVDLSQFQFDYDLNWAAMFINADGTVYARYGTQSAKGADAYNSVEGLRNTMLRVLELHRNYPNNKAQLAGKLGRKKPYKTAIDMPGLPGTKHQLLGTTTVRNCIHCHMLHDAEHVYAQDSGKMSHEMLWRYPLPENLGISVDAVHGRKVTSLKGAASQTGLQVGEELTHLNGQALTSIADLQWALHNLSNKSESIKVHGSRTGEHTIKVAPGWKRTDVSWRGSMWSVEPQLNTWMPRAETKVRRAVGLDDTTSALHVRYINPKKPGGKAVLRAGLRKGDVVIALDGRPVADTDAKFMLNLTLNHKVGDTIELTVLRKKERKTIRVQLVR